MIVKPLNTIPFSKIVDCFLESFQNYFVKMPTEPSYYKERWKNAKVDLELSYGMFDKEKLIGFIINAIDKRNGVITAYNTGTGVIPNYRNQKIIKQIYKHAIPILKAKGIERCLLEVIVENHIAIKAYSSIGFKKIRRLKCFSGSINTPEVVTTIEKLNINRVKDIKLTNQNYYSWDHHKNCLINNSNFHFYQILNNHKIESYFIMDSNGYIAQFEVFKNSNESWNRLFNGIKSVSKEIRINNIDENLQEKIEFLNSIGIKNTIDQYEMEMML